MKTSPNKRLITKLIVTGASVLAFTMLAAALPSSFSPMARRMVVIFGIAAVYWSLEIIPAHATAILVVVLQILLIGRWKSGGEGVPYEEFLIPLGSPVIMLFLGGFILAEAMRKYHVDTLLASRLVPRFGSRPSMVMLGFMATTMFFALWMSATATCAMMLAVITPILAQLEPDDPFRKALVLAIPFGARAGSVGTPVATPPNALAVGMLREKGVEVGFSSWMAIGVPLTVVILLISAVVLTFVYRPRHAAVRFELPPPAAMSRRARATVGIAAGMIVLWVTSKFHGLPADVVALAGVVCYLGTGLLDANDLKRINWDILILMWGGLALGIGLEKTGMARSLVGLPMFADLGALSLPVFCVLAMAFSTFLSNTTTANLLLPLALGFPSDNPLLLPIAVALACSFDIPLPVSSPPNALAFSTGEVTVPEMLRAGTPVTLLTIIVIIFFSARLIPLVF